jgi:dCMP deaminase
MRRPSWDEWGLLIAKAVSARADCTRRQVGAVILDANHRVVATGYNGAPPGATGCLEGGCPRGRRSYEDVPAFTDYDNCISNHAEVNALLYADRSKAEGGTLYVTDAPCFGCSKVIANSGIDRVVVADART